MKMTCFLDSPRSEHFNLGNIVYPIVVWSQGLKNLASSGTRGLAARGESPALARGCMRCMSPEAMT